MSLLFTVVDLIPPFYIILLAGFLLQWPWGPVASLASPPLYCSSLAAQQKGSRQSAKILARGKIRRFNATYLVMPRPDGANIATRRHKSDFDHNRRLG